MFNAIEVASLFATLELRDSATPALRGFAAGLDQMGQRLQQFGGQLQSAGVQISALTAPFVAFGAQGVNVAATFEQAMATISARTGLTGDALEEIRQLSLQMGADTAFSAQQAADAFLELLSSGQSAEEAIATLPAVLDAAAASGEDLGATADDVTNILATFRMPATSARRVVDALSRAAGASSADMADLGDSFANVGGIAAQFGLDIETTASIFAIFAENGIKGAEAGTQLRSMLLNMSRDTDSTTAAWAAFGTSLYDAQGNLRRLPEVLDEIARASVNMTDQEKQQAFADLAGSYGILGLTALTSSTDIGTMLGAMGRSAEASDVAAARMGTFAGATDSLRGSIETLQIQALTPFMNDVLRPLVQDMTVTINKVTEWAAANPELTTTIAQIVGIVALFGAGLVILGTVIGAAGTVLSAFGTTVGIVAGAITFLTSAAILPLIPVLLLVGGLVLAYATNWLGFRDTVDAIGLSIRLVIGDLTELQNLMTTLSASGLIARFFGIKNNEVTTDWSTGNIIGGGGVQNKPFVGSGMSDLGTGTAFNNAGTAYVAGMGGGAGTKNVPGKGGMQIGSLTVNWQSNGDVDDYAQFIANLERMAAGR